MAAPRSPRDSALITGAAQSGARHTAPYRQADCATRAWNRGGVAGRERGGASPGAGLWERGAALRGPHPGGRAWGRSQAPRGVRRSGVPRTSPSATWLGSPRCWSLVSREPLGKGRGPAAPPRAARGPVPSGVDWLRAPLICSRREAARGRTGRAGV